MTSASVFRYTFGFILLLLSFWLTWRAIERTLKAEKEKSRSPFGEKLLRPAGESLRLRINGIEEEILEAGMRLVGAFFLPSLLLFLPSAGKALPFWIVWGVTAIVCYSYARVQWKKIFQLRKRLRNHRLGFDGERYIAAELDTLRAKGFRIFHDFLVDWKPGGETTNFNIDHIAVGPCGIFAIETKARRKPNEEQPGNRKTHQAIYTGTALQFAGSYADEKPIQQAIKNAKALSQWLTGSSGSPLPVHAVVVVPGWFIDRKCKGTVRVLSGKELAGHLPGLEKPGLIAEVTLRQAADRIETHCRNVEGA